MHADTSAVSLAFQRWLRDNGVVLGAIELSSVAIEGSIAGGDGESESDRPRPRRRRTVLSTARSAPGALIARVPDAAVLSVSSSSAAESLEAAGLGNRGAQLSSPSPSSPSSSSSSSSWREATGLALALLVEARMGDDSRFAPYVRWLLYEGKDEEGEEDDTRPVTWDPRAAALLFAGTAVAARLLQLPPSSDGEGGGGIHAPSAAPLAWSRLARPWLSRVGIEEDARARKRAGKAKRSTPSPSSSSSLSLRDEFFKCLAVVCSHAFVLGEDQILALVPVFDALDHSPGPPRVRLSHSGGGAEEEGDEDSGSGGDSDGSEEENNEEGFLEMRSTVPLSHGEEVFNSYGRLSTSALARRYGFAVADREEMLRSGDEKLEVTAGEVGAAAAAVVSSPSSSSSFCSVPLRAPAACLRAATASRGRALFVGVLSGKPSPGLLLAVRASLLSPATTRSRRRRREPREEEGEEEGEEEENKRASPPLLEGHVLLEVARRRRAALEAGGKRAARAALAKLGGGAKKRKRGRESENEKQIKFPSASGFELAEAVRSSELEGCACLESWVERML